MAQETELKLAIPPEQFAALHRHPLFAQASAAASTVTLVNTYFDTPKLKLHRRNVVLRLRQTGRRQLQTVKAGGGSAGGLSSRGEWEQDCRGKRFDFAAIDRPEIRRLLEKSEDKLRPVFTTTVRRETRRLQPHPGCSVLMMLDRGEVAVGERTEALAEIELELEKGSPDDLFDLALRLADGLSLRPENESKDERGYRLYSGSPRQARHAGPSPVTREQSAWQAFDVLANDALQMWEANAAGLQEARPEEFVHQLRIAVRRLRTLLRVFSPLLPQPFTERWMAEFEQLGQRVGEARDADVLLAEILQPVLGQDGSESGSELLRLAQSAGAESRRAAFQWLLSGERLRLPLEFTRDLHALERNASFTRIDRFAADALGRLRKKAQKRLKTAAQENSDASLHRLRIALKRLRYTLEFFAPLLPGKSLSITTQALGKAQDDLGYLNDIVVAGHKFAHWQDENAVLKKEAKAVIDWHRPRARKLRRTILPQVEKILHAKVM